MTVNELNKLSVAELMNIDLSQIEVTEQDIKNAFKDKQKEYLKRYRETHREKFNEYQRNYYKTHREKANEYQRNYRKRLAQRKILEELIADKSVNSI